MRTSDKFILSEYFELYERLPRRKNGLAMTTTRRFTTLVTIWYYRDCRPREGAFVMDKPNVPTLPKSVPTKFFSEVVAELSKVTWPTRAETIKLTMAVIVISVAVGIFVGGLDILFLKLSSLLFRK